MNCLNCGTEHNGKFCPSCGTPASRQTVYQRSAQNSSNQSSWEDILDDESNKKSPHKAMKKSKKGCAYMAIAVLAIAITLVVLVQTDSGNSDSPGSSNTSDAIVIDSSELILEGAYGEIELAIRQSGVKVEDAYVSQLMGEEGSEDEMMMLSFRVRGFVSLTDNLTRVGCLMDIEDVMRSIQGKDGYSFLQVMVLLDGENAYGEAADVIAMSATITKEAIDRINFDNFNYENIPTISDSFSQHHQFD